MRHGQAPTLMGYSPRRPFSWSTAHGAWGCTHTHGLVTTPLTRDDPPLPALLAHVILPARVIPPARVAPQAVKFAGQAETIVLESGERVTVDAGQTSILTTSRFGRAFLPLVECLAVDHAFRMELGAIDAAMWTAAATFGEGARSVPLYAAAVSDKSLRLVAWNAHYMSLTLLRPRNCRRCTAVCRACCSTRDCGGSARVRRALRA